MRQSRGTTCPSCNSTIPNADINIAEGVALCRTCDKLWKLRDLAADPEEGAADAAASAPPPSGCSIQDLGSETVISASCRGGTGCFFAFFATFWNSITWIFVTIAAGGLYTNLIGPLPSWYPMSNSTVKSGSTSTTVAAMPLNMAIFLALFITPFVLIGIGTAAAAVLGLFGRVQITLRGQDATVFTGVGPIGWTRRFNADTVRDVRIKESGSSTNNKPNKHIVIDADKTVKVGVLLSDARLRWLAGVLRRVLLPH
jgi:hypothetical protein